MKDLDLLVSNVDSFLACEVRDDSLTTLFSKASSLDVGFSGAGFKLLDYALFKSEYRKMVDLELLCLSDARVSELLSVLRSYSLPDELAKSGYLDYANVPKLLATLVGSNLRRGLLKGVSFA